MDLTTEQLDAIKQKIKSMAQDAGFQDARVTDCNTDRYFERYQQWIANGYHGDMSFLERNMSLRKSPPEIVSGALRVISFRYNYLPQNAQFTTPLKEPGKANISRYALGKDYHKLLRKKLSRICDQLSRELNAQSDLSHRVFVDSAPVLETAFAEKSGIGWKGKHTLVINKDAGSWFFLAEILINLPLAIDPKVENQCGKCNACISICPTGAIVAPYQVDATRCISYLTIENKQAIPTELRPLMGNRIYGCDDCQLACPWNRYSKPTSDQSFNARNLLDNISLMSLWEWDEETFLKRLEGSPIRRIGFQNWLRNLAVAIGNSEYQEEKIVRLSEKKSVANAMVCEHIDWAIEQLTKSKNKPLKLSNNTGKLINTIQVMFPRDA